MALLFSLICITFGSAAQAHPIAAEITAHQLRLTLGKTHVTVDYQVWIPNSHLVEEPQETNPLQTHLQEAKDGLSLLINDNPTALTLLPLEGSGVQPGGHVTGFQVALQAELPSQMGRQEVLLVNSVEPDELANYNTEVFIHPSLQVLETSLLDLEEGELTANRHAQWRMDEESRETHVVVRKHPRILQFTSTGKFRPIHKALGFPWMALMALGIGGLAIALAAARIMQHRKHR
ncbi:MAG: hypothetical protein VX519_05320 [Myxococcota bacterium]|nr:hypothetical protein [Myxococcota bacterium]